MGNGILPPMVDDSQAAHWDGVRKAYDTVAEDYAAYFPDTRPEDPLDLSQIDSFAEIAKECGGPVLDAGCGAGRITRYLADRGVDARGVDLSPTMINIARRVHPDLTFDVAQLAALPFPDKTFGGVMLWYSIIHTPPAGLTDVLTEVVRVARPGAAIIIGYQSGGGTRDVSASYRRLGHEIELERYLYDHHEFEVPLRKLGCELLVQMLRPPVGFERDPQGVVLMRLQPHGWPALSVD